MRSCRGWEWCSNNQTQCRRCGADLSDPPSKAKSPAPKRRARTRQSSRDSQNSAHEELLSLLQSQLPALQSQFPDLAKHVQVLAPQPAPAAVLHGAQTNCQIVFKELQMAEQTAKDLEVEAADLVVELQQKVAALAEAQATVLEVRKKYDEAAQNAQEVVQKHRPTSAVAVAASVDDLAKQLEPDQLEAAAIAFNQAAKAARDAKANVPVSAPLPSQTATMPAGMEVEPNKEGLDESLLGGGEQPPAQPLLGQLLPQLLSGGVPPSQGTGQVAPGSISPGASKEAPAAANPGSLPPGPSVGETPAPERTSSRSPRRTTAAQSPRSGKSKSPSPVVEPPPSKLSKGDAQDDAHKARGRSTSTAVSAGSGKSGVAAGLDAQHYQKIAEQIKQNLDENRAVQALSDEQKTAP